MPFTTMFTNKSTFLKPHTHTWPLHTHLALNGPFGGWLRLTNDVNVVQVLLANLEDYVLDVGTVNARLAWRRTSG